MIISREEAEDLMEWAEEHAPDLIPTYDDPEEVDWQAVWIRIGAAHFAWTVIEYNRKHPPVEPPGGFDKEPF